MEKAIETAIDNGLESISSELYMFSVGIGITIAGLICLVIGIAAVVSGFIQM